MYVPSFSFNCLGMAYIWHSSRHRPASSALPIARWRTSVTIIRTATLTARICNECFEVVILQKSIFSSYRHFILQLNARSTDSDYYKRAVRQKGRIVFDLNRKSNTFFLFYFSFFVLLKQLFSVVFKGQRRSFINFKIFYIFIYILLNLSTLFKQTWTKRMHSINDLFWTKIWSPGV